MTSTTVNPIRDPEDQPEPNEMGCSKWILYFVMLGYIGFLWGRIELLQKDQKDTDSRFQQLESRVNELEGKP